jgi:hypothetical protein
MKTALIKTTIWKDDSFCQLPIDTQYLFLYLSTSPERNCTRFYQQRELVIASYVSMILPTFQECMKQLSEKGFAYYFDGWVIIGNDSFMQPKTGKDSQRLYAEDYAKVPDHIIDFAEKMMPDCSRTALEYINKHKDINKHIAKHKDNAKNKVNDQKAMGIDLEKIKEYSDEIF